MVVIDLLDGDSILVEEKSEKRPDVVTDEKKKDFFLGQELNLQLITYQRFE